MKYIIFAILAMMPIKAFSEHFIVESSYQVNVTIANLEKKGWQIKDVRSNKENPGQYVIVYDISDVEKAKIMNETFFEVVGKR